MIIKLFIIISIFLSGCEQKEELEANPIDYAGIGIRLELNGQVPIVMESFAGGPAFVAGIRKCDFILAIDEFKTYNKSLAEIVNRLRGEKGSMLQVKVKSRGGKVSSFELRRAKVIKAVLGNEKDKEYLPE